MGKKNIKKKIEKTGVETEAEDYDWDSITKAVKSLFTGTGSFADKISQKADSISRVASTAAAGAKKATYTSKGGYSDTLSKLFCSGTSAKTTNKKED